MSTEPEMVVDRGHIRQIDPADGWVAVFGVAYSPYYRVYPIVRWGIVKRDGEERIEGFVPIAGSRTLDLLSFVDDGIYIDTIYLPLYTSPLFSDANGNSAFTAVTALAIKYGQELERQTLEDAQ